MIRALQLRLVEWGRLGHIPDDQDVFDDWRRRIVQESKTLARIKRNRLLLRLTRHRTAAE